MRDVLSRLIDDYHERSLPEPMPREYRMPEIAGKASVIIGMRRAGKTWLCYQHMRSLLAGGVPKERLLYLNFEDDRLLPFTAADFQTILDVYYGKHPELKSQRCHLFLDEVQRIEHWETFIRRVLDTEDLAVYLTGSSSKLLSSEIATALRGRSYTLELFPFSFSEFLRYRSEYPSGSRLGAKTRAVLQNRIEQYARIGGFPEVQRLEDEPRREILRNYVDVVILRDVVERHRVSNVAALRAMMRHVMSAPATRFSLNKFYNTLQSQGVSCAKNSLYDYVGYLEDTFLLYRVPIHSRSERVRRVNPSKVYVIDPGLLEAMSFHITEDRGLRLENVIFMHLRRRGTKPEYYVTRDGAEIDFVVPARSGEKRLLLQVCWSLEDPATRRRETEALETAMKELRIDRGTIVSWMDEGTIDDRIDIVPAWKWLLQT